MIQESYLKNKLGDNMIEELTKERIDAFLKEKKRMNELLRARGDEIISKAKENGVDLCVSGCDSIHICDDDECYLVEEWYARGESGADYSINIPTSALYSDEELDLFIQSEKEEYERRERERKQAEDSRDREEFKRLKKKFGNG